MKSSTIIILLVLLLSALLIEAQLELKKIQVLTLYADRQTAALRSNSMPQLSCTGGSAKRFNKLFPQVVQCTNVGIDQMGEVQWKCAAELDEKVSLGAVQVSCEGFSRPGDKYVLEGSCGLEYDLNLTPKGEKHYYGNNRNNNYNNINNQNYQQQQQQQQQYQQQQQQQQQYQRTQRDNQVFGQTDNSSGSGSGTLLMVIIVIVVLVFIVMRAKRATTQQRGNSPSGSYNEDRSSSRAYTSAANFGNSSNIYPSTNEYTSSSSNDYNSSSNNEYTGYNNKYSSSNSENVYGSANANNSSSSNNNGVSWGAAAASTLAGVAGGYAMGRMSNGSSQQAQATMYPNPSYNSGSYAAPNNNSYGANMYPNSPPPQQPSYNNYSSSSQSYGNSADNDDSTTRKSTGYGGSKVR